MKFLLFSDSHKHTNGMDAAISAHSDITRIIHCGDMAEDVEYLNDVYGRTHSIISVCGNNDYSAPDPFLRIIHLEDHKVYITHGHKERVKSSLLLLKKCAKAEGCDICIFGHTHTQHHSEEDGITFVNPGSIGYFKGAYAAIDITSEKVKVTLYKK